MRSYMNFAVVTLAASIISPVLSAPTQYRYGNLLVKFKGRVFLISGIPILDSAADVFHARPGQEKGKENLTPFQQVWNWLMWPKQTKPPTGSTSAQVSDSADSGYDSDSTVRPPPTPPTPKAPQRTDLLFHVSDPRNPALAPLDPVDK
jgi:hypothetical protein